MQYVRYVIRIMNNVKFLLLQVGIKQYRVGFTLACYTFSTRVLVQRYSNFPATRQPKGKDDLFSVLWLQYDLNSAIIKLGMFFLYFDMALSDH